MSKKTTDEIMKLNNKEIEQAVFSPIVPHKTKIIFDFVSKNSNLTTERSGMQGYSTGIDRYKMIMLAKEYEIDLTPYDFFITFYESKMLEQQSRQLNKK